MLKLKEAIESVNSFMNSPLVVSESVKCSNLIVKAFENKGISHYNVAMKMGCDVYELSLNLLNTDSYSKIGDDGSLMMDVLDVHKLCKHMSDAYVQSCELGEIGVVIYNDPEINKLFDFPEECVYPEVEEMIKAKGANNE